MNVSPTDPFKLVYSLFQHEYLGYLFESFVVQLDEKQRLSFSFQNISSKNAREFDSGMEEKDYEIIRLMDSMQQDAVVQHFHKRKIKTPEFFLKIYDKDKGNEVVQREISNYLERRRAKILSLLAGKTLFVMGKDGYPAWKQLEIHKEKASILFHFRKNVENTHYFPTIKHGGERIEFKGQGAYLICNDPAWLVLKDEVFGFEQQVDGNKIKPFLHKKFILIPEKVEETYYKKFVAPLIASFDVYAKGFDIIVRKEKPMAILNFGVLSQIRSLELFSGNGNDNGKPEPYESNKILFELDFLYANKSFRSDRLETRHVELEKENGRYVFHKIYRDSDQEKRIVSTLAELGLGLKNGRKSVAISEAFSWINHHRSKLEALGIELRQNEKDEQKYFVGESHISFSVKENIDWFDIEAVIRFGDYEMSFFELKKHIKNKNPQVDLPNGQIAVIPSDWFEEYAELFNFAEKKGDQDKAILKKHHLALVNDLEKSQFAKVTLSRKLQKLKNFEEIEDCPLPDGFKGTLRPYQKAGFNWMQFLSSYSFGGCLADDMGLGKTVQTLAMLQQQKELNPGHCSLLVMPTSLVYNWEMEASKFTPNLKVLNYTGTHRDKNIERFKDYDLVLTSYGIIRLDIELLQEYYFNYVILDESQAIKNPDSNIARSVKRLKSRQRLILTGTPLENSTMDLWSQMTFINPGLLGNKAFFKTEFLTPIERKSDKNKIQKLYTIIKPFILRRQKNQVAKDLPEKIENVVYCSMTVLQEEKYQEVKDFYREKILSNIKQEGVKKSQFLLLQGLTQLRQIANHPKMVDQDYTGDSGKMEDLTHKLFDIINEGHKVLVFSQFVKHLEIVKQYLNSQKIPFAYLDGSTRDRRHEVDQFQNNPDLKVFLISLKAGGVGLNLTAAEYVFLLDPWWNPAIENQAVDRAHRIGQDKKVFTYKFISRNTVEEKILKLQQRKLMLASELITTEDSFVKNLSQEDIESLLD